ncbi:hypothetical protein NX059_004437 [Plenodomus lindquistii]|nr:hypothetical protein NX059_004437 [Plenodomus lindquistii]
MASSLAAKATSWAPPLYPQSTAENDGTNDNRYDVRKTLAYVTDDTNNVNNVFMLYWITTTTGEKYHLTTNAGLRGSQVLGSFLSFNDLQTGTTRGASIMEPGTGNKARLEMRGASQTVIAPEDGDKWTNTAHMVDLCGVKLETVLQPTGQQFYYGGSGGIQLQPRGPDPDYSTSLPGWSWYWVRVSSPFLPFPPLSSPFKSQLCICHAEHARERAFVSMLILTSIVQTNPTTRVQGSITVDGKRHEIDPEQSFSIFERQWGNFHIFSGYIALWFWLETGEVLISWNMEPTADGVSKVAFASIWHPNGLHETIPVGPNTKFSDLRASKETGIKYFNKFFLDLPARNASFTFEKWFSEDELRPVEGQRYITIGESYGEGTAKWNGKDIKIHGHVEQLSSLK